MTYIAQPIPVAARLVDTDSKITAAQALALRAADIDGVIRYLGSITRDELDGILAAELRVSFVTFADAFDGEAAVAQLRALDVPAFATPRVTVWLDLESDTNAPAIVIAKVNAWAAAIRTAGYDPGLYLGANQPLTSDQVGELDVDRYWQSVSYVMCPTLHGSPIGFCMVQLDPPNQMLAGVEIDYDVAQHDYRGRAATWLTALPDERETEKDLSAAA